MFTLKCSLTELRGFWDTLAPGFQWEKISGRDKGWGSALRRAMKKRSDFVLRFPPKGGEFDYNNGVFRGVLGRQERDFLNINVPGS